MITAVYVTERIPVAPKTYLKGSHSLPLTAAGEFVGNCIRFFPPRNNAFLLHRSMGFVLIIYFFRRPQPIPLFQTFLFSSWHFGRVALKRHCEETGEIIWVLFCHASHNSAEPESSVFPLIRHTQPGPWWLASCCNRQTHFNH